MNLPWKLTVSTRPGARLLLGGILTPFHHL
mgnify:CR=1 FL=1